MSSTSESFNVNVYTELLSNAKKNGYRFIGFNDISTSNDVAECLLRHDVDVDLQAAFKMAQIEYKLGIKSTYFVMLRSPCYNLLSRENSTILKEILKLGHDLGLHYDHGYDLIRGFDSKQTERLITKESEFLSELFLSEIYAVSFHQPASAVLKGEISTGHLVNTYDREKLRSYEYFSDSNRTFPLSKNKIPLDISLSKKHPANIQLLIHPMWWIYPGGSTENVWDKAILSNLEMTQRQLLETERAFGRKRTFSITCEQE